MKTLSSGYVRKDRKTWRAVLCYMDDDNSQKKISANTGVKCFPDKKDPQTGRVVKRDVRGKGAAEDFLRRWRDLKVREFEEREDSVGCMTTLYGYAKDYVDMKELSGNIVASTVVGYRAHLKHLLGTQVGNTEICKVTPRQLQRWEQQMLKDGSSPTTVSHAHVFLKGVFKKARSAGDISSNPFDLVEPPRRRKQPINSLDKSGLAKLNSLISDEYGPLEIAVRLATMAGMRQGEICALRWSDIDRVSRIIHVNHALVRSNGHYEIGAPKTDSSSRSIPFGQGLSDALGERLAIMIRERGDLNLPWDDSLFVIGSSLDGGWKSPMALGKEWRTFARVTKLRGTQGTPPRFHDLRHTFATIAIASDVDVKVVSAILGHASASMTLDVYADALDESKRQGMDRLDSVLSA